MWLYHLVNSVCPAPVTVLRNTRVQRQEPEKARRVEDLVKESPARYERHERLLESLS